MKIHRGTNILRKAVFMLLLCIVCSNLACTNAEQMITDRAVVDHFIQNKPVYEELAAMLAVDADIGRIDTYNVVPNNLPLTSNRVAQYRTLMARAKVSVIMIIGEELRFSVSLTEGNSYDLGFSVMPIAPSRVLKTFDGYTCVGTDVVYRHIEGNWFAFVVCTPRG